MKKFVGWGLIIFVVSFLLYFAICSYTYSEGQRSGVLLKFSKKGFVFKTYEGEINAGFINTRTTNLAANLFDFSVLAGSNDVIEMMKSLDGKQVKIFYKQKVKAMPWQGDTDYLVYKVEEIKSNN